MCKHGFGAVRFGLCSPHSERAFLYEIVANGRNSIDVDKFDYLGRDTFNLGLKSSYDFTRLMNFSRVIGDEICYHSKEVYNLYEVRLQALCAICCTLSTVAHSLCTDVPHAVQFVQTGASLLW